jgi:TetR/AcrR family transcriptional regulator
MADSVNSQDKSSPRRSPRPEERQRDPERTRRVLLDAAQVEFAAKGRAGARVSEIARRAGVSKQLISYYFGGKDGLYDALIGQWLEQEAEFAPRELPLDELVARYIRDGIDHRDMHRVLIREGIEGVATPDMENPEGDEGGVEVADLRRRQAEGELADDLDPGLLMLMLQGVASAGVVYPADVRKLTGLDPASEEFARRYADLVGRVIRRLAGS